MKIISFLLIYAITCSTNQLLDELQITSFGQSLEQTILLQLQYDETKLKSILQEIQQALDEEQIQDNINFKQEYDSCNNNDLENEIITIKYEHSSIYQKIKMLNNSFEFQVLKQKQRELLYNQEQLQLTIKQYEQAKQIEENNLYECDELLKLLQYIRFQFEKKVLNQLSNQKNQVILTQMKNDIQEHYKIMNKLLKKQSFNNYIKILISSFDENNESFDKLFDIITDIIEIVEKNKDQIRQQYDELIQKNQQQIQYFQNNIQEVQNEINLLNNQQSQIEKDISYFNQQLNQIDQILQMKNNLLEDKQTFCLTLKEDFQEYRAFRDDQREQLQKIITLAERNIFEIKDYYIQNGRLRQ